MIKILLIHQFILFFVFFETSVKIKSFNQIFTLIL